MRAWLNCGHRRRVMVLLYSSVSDLQQREQAGQLRGDVSPVGRAKL